MTPKTLFQITNLLILTIAASGLAACGTDSIHKEANYPSGENRRANPGGDIYAKPSSIFGSHGLLGGHSSDDNQDGSTGIAVNSFLWRAALDTVSFMPLASADPFGGTILTDWYSPSGTTNERFKVNVFILGKQLRSDGVRVRVFKQVNSKGSWFDSAVSDDTGRKLEDSILTRARQLRVAQMGREE